MRPSSNPITRRKNLTVGAADAESDDMFLEECYVDTGDLSILSNTADPRCVVVGRTGAGKSALLKEFIKSHDRCIELSPEALSLRYISNSNIVAFFEEMGAPLDLFYQLLWRHVLTVELIQAKYCINDMTQKHSFLQMIATRIMRDRSKQRALEYLEKWGDRFWEETELRVKELTTRIETELSASVGTAIDLLPLGAEGARRLNEEQRAEILNRTKRVVNDIQIKELKSIIDLLADDIFTDTKAPHYIVIDRLDEDWAPEPIRLRLIKALIETIKKFRKVQPVKILIALRSDLLQRVLLRTAGAGFQEEKYQSLFLKLNWDKELLCDLLDRRVRFAFRRQYTKHNVGLSEILPSNQIDQGDAIDYILDRTFLRPRDVIQYFNECLAQPFEGNRFKVATLRAAEIEYSRSRLRACADEWRDDYPMLLVYFKILKEMPATFYVRDLEGEVLEEWAVGIATTVPSADDPIDGLVREYYERGKVPLHRILREVVSALYKVGAIGIKRERYEAWQWSYLHAPMIAEGEIESETRLAVHQAFWVALGVRRARR